MRLARRALPGVLAVSALITATMLLAQVRLQSPDANQSGPATPAPAIVKSIVIHSNSGRPSLHELVAKMAEYERTYLPYYIRSVETLRVAEGLTRQEKLRCPWSDGRKRESEMEYAQTGDRFWFRKETRRVDGVAKGRSEQYSDGKQFVAASFQNALAGHGGRVAGRRAGDLVTVNIEHDPRRIQRWVAATPLRGIFPLAVFSNGDLFSRIFAGKESQIQLAWDGEDARLTFKFGPGSIETRFVLWLSRAHDWHPVKLQRFLGPKAKEFFDEWVVTRFLGGSRWRVAEGTVRFRDFQDAERPQARILFSTDFRITVAEWGYQAIPPGDPFRTLFPEISNRMFEYQIPEGADVHDSRKPKSDQPQSGPTRAITVRVVEIAGKPVPGAVVRISARLDPRELDRVMTNQEGIALSPKAPEEGDLFVQANAAGYRPAGIVFGGEPKQMRVLLAPQTHGLAVDEKGRPLAKVWLPVARLSFRNDGLPYRRVRGDRDDDWGAADGRFVLKSPLTLRNAHQLVPLIGIDDAVERMAIAFVAPKDLAQPQRLVFKPVCHVHGGCLLAGMTDVKSLSISIGVEASNGETIASLSGRLQREPRGLRVDWDFLMPEGTYRVHSRPSSFHPGFDLPVTIPPGQKELNAGIKEIPASGLVALKGKPAPKLAVQWRGGEETRLEQLRGRVVVLDFWGTWCIPCVEEIPELMDIADRFRGRPVEWIAIHTPTRNGFGWLGRQLNDLKHRVWKNRELTFKTVIDQPVPDHEDSGETQIRYGVAEWPTVVVIDQEGKIVGPVEKEDLADTIAALLK